MALVLYLARDGLYTEINIVEKMQLFWEGIHLVSGYFNEHPSKKKILLQFRVISTGPVFPGFFMKCIGYQLRNSTSRYFYGAIRSDLAGC